MRISTQKEIGRINKAANPNVSSMVICTILENFYTQRNCENFDLLQEICSSNDEGSGQQTATRKREIPLQKIIFQTCFTFMVSQLLKLDFVHFWHTCSPQKWVECCTNFAALTYFRSNETSVTRPEYTIKTTGSRTRRSWAVEVVKELLPIHMCLLWVRKAHKYTWCSSTRGNPEVIPHVDRVSDVVKAWSRYYLTQGRNDFVEFLDSIPHRVLYGVCAHADNVGVSSTLTSFLDEHIRI
jgi:hypothetical protein